MLSKNHGKFINYWNIKVTVVSLVLGKLPHGRLLHWSFLARKSPSLDDNHPENCPAPQKIDLLPTWKIVSQNVTFLNNHQYITETVVKKYREKSHKKYLEKFPLQNCIVRYLIMNFFSNKKDSRLRLKKMANFMDK